MTFDEILEQNRPDQDNYDNAVAMSQRFQKATESPGFVENPFLNLEDAAKASRNPVNRVYNENDLKNITSDVGTIAWDSFRKGVMDLQSVGDKAYMAIGNTLAGISGNTLGTEMRDRAADSLMKTMEESRFVDSNYGDAETWTSRFVGGGMSMAEMLAVGAATGAAGLGAYVGTLSLSDGALNDMVKYQEEHGNLDGYETDPKNLALDYLNAVFQIATEEVGGTGRLLNGRVFKAGSTGNAILKETVLNFLQESAQGAATDLTEVLKGNQDISVLSENIIGYMKDGVVAGVLGGAIGGSAYKLNKNRALQNLDKINAVINPNATPAEIREKSEQVFEKTEEKMLKSFVPELMAQNEAINDKGAIRENVRTKIASMYEDADMSEQEKAQTIEATTSLELENMLYDSIERKIPLTANPLLQGEVNGLGWFRNGIPEQRRQEIENLRKEYVNLRDELKAQNESAEKDYNKIDELETKLEVFRTELPNRLQDLIVADREQIRKMLAEQRESVADSQAKKRMISAIKRKAQSAIKAQEKADTKLAEQMARGAEKAQLQREKKETTQQTKEAKIRDLQEQREIARAIKNVKVDIARKKAKESVVEPDYTEDMGYNALKQQGYTDEQIAKMSAQQIEKAIAERPKNVMLQEQFDLADENARLDDMYPAYEGKTIRIIDAAELKQAQFEKIQETNPMLDSYHVGIRSVNDIKTFDETINDEESFVWGDYSREDAKRDLAKNEITIYSSKPIGNGVFVSTSRVQAQEYAGGKGAKVYERTVPLDYVAWISGDEGQFALTSVVGKKRSVFNSNGERIAQSEPALRNFYKWFGNSKVVDEQGRPLVVYHGTDAKFDTFDTKTYGGAFGFGAYFSDSYAASESYGENVFETYLKIENPLIINNENIRYANDSYAKANGYDGIINDDYINGFRAVEYVAFEPNQIKSVDNRGTYSSDTGNIYYQETKEPSVNGFVSIDGEKPTLLYSGMKGAKLNEIDAKPLWLSNKQDVAQKFLGQSDNSQMFIGYAKTNNPIVIDGRGKPWHQLNMPKEFGFTNNRKWKTDDITIIAFQKGYDAVIFKNIKETEAKIGGYLFAGKADTIVVKNAQKQLVFEEDMDYQTQMQPKTTGGKDTYRGAYLPEYRFIAKTENMDASTLNHELAHDWGQEYFRWARSGKASESFLRSWGAVEKAIGITDNDTYFTYDASEKFARAYEGWLLQKKDWAKILKIDNDDDKKAVESMMEDYRKQLVDIYESLVESSKYFKGTFGEVGELKPELVDFFERATRYDDIELREKRGEITAEQANQEKLNHLVETAVNGQVENMPAEQAQEADAIGQIQDLQETANDTERFETEGGNVKSLQRRLDRIALAQDLTQNDKDLGKYDSRRDMLAVAEQADEFVQNRRDDALAIINGEMAEQDGLYASDLYTALERVANSTGDFDLIQELRSSKIANEIAKELGQRIAGFRNYKGSGDVDVVSVLNSLDKQLKTEYNKNKSTADEYIGDLVAELKSVDNNAQLDAFFDEIECR